MRVRTLNQHLYIAVATALVAVLAGSGNPVIAGTVDLNASPPNLTTAVPPNIVFTFDDSGSMQANRLSDNPPWSTDTNGNLLNSAWDWSQGPWRCSNVIDPVATSGIRAATMNGVYYNPNITYSPPKYSTGKSFLDADSTLKAVWVDGIDVNRPLNPVTADADSIAAYNNNPDLNRATSTGNTYNASAKTNLMAQAAITNVTTYYASFGSTCSSNADSGSCQTKSSGGSSSSGYYFYINYADGNTGSGISTVYYGTGLKVRNSSSTGYTKVPGDKTSATKNYETWTVTAPGIDTSQTDNRWQCGTGQAASGGGGDMWSGSSPMDGQTHTLSDGTSVTYPNGGPYYYRLKTTVTISLDQYGNPDSSSTGLKALYSANNWEAIPVLVSQYKNFANWYAYYRTRNQMARSAMSRVFGDPSLAAATANSGYGGNQRVAWQNLNTGTYKLPSTAIISELIDTANCKTGTNGATASPSATQQSGTATAPPDCYRSAFYKWIFQGPASGGTPTRSGTNRAGQFFTRGKNHTGATGNLSDPYWQPPVSGSFDATTNPGNELFCRQNYHMLVTDGLWNGSADGPKTSTLTLPSSAVTLPDGVTMPDPTAAGVTSIYNPVDDGGDTGYASLSDIAFHYWATNLRSDLYIPAVNPPQIVAPYLPDHSTGVFGLSGTVASTVPATKINPEIYFNPKNDPATWPHMGEFLVGLGVNGSLNYSENTDCTNTTVAAQKDACLLRQGNTNSSGSVGWPTPDGTGSGIAANIDDTWHAALDGRGAFFSAGDPQQLVTTLTRFLASISARAGTSVALTTSVNVATANTAGYSGGYNADWSGNLPEYAIDPTTGQSIPPPVLDAACILTGITPTAPCPTTGETSVTQNPTPANRKVYTYGTSGTPTQPVTATNFASLNTADQTALNCAVWNSTTNTCTTADSNGQLRVKYLLGDRTQEATGSTPQFRPRSSLLGAIIDAQPTYVGSPSGNYADSWPAGSPEMVSGAQTYSAFVKAINGRPPIIYAAANDGMLHAFSSGGVTVSSTGTVTVNPGGGVEQWAYIPQTVIQNGAVTNYVNSTGGLIATVDGSFSTQDVFFTSDSKWHTILVGTLRYGGRGAFALDITNGTNPPKVLWEVSNASTGMADLGYTYSKPDITRINYNDGTNKGKWVVLLPSGYMPSGSPASDTATTTESLFVLDAETGTVIKELNTLTLATQSGHPTSASGANGAFGLGTPTVWGGANNVGLFAAAGDLMGNLWRFDLSDANPSNWKVDWMFQTPASGTRTTPTQQPITVEPNAFSDTNNGGNPIWVFGTGKYLAAVDNTSTSAPTQSFYGIRDYGTGSSKYPIQASALVSQTLSQSTNGLRALTQCGVTGCTPSANVAPGWKFDMVSAGERAVVTGTPLYSAGQVILTTLIPTNNNPCQPGLTGAVMVVDAVSGGAPTGNPPVGGSYAGGQPSGTGIVGSTVANPPIAGNGTPVVTPLGGGTVLIPGMPGFNISDSFWHRRSWRELLNQL